MKSDAKSYLAQFQVIPGTSSIIEVTQVGKEGRASVIECNFEENKLRETASWDAVYFDSHAGLSTSRENKRGAIHIWTLSANGDQLECHTLLGELVQSHRLPHITLGRCTWGPNRWNVEGNAKTLTGIHLRDHCEWHFDFANDLAPLPTDFGKRLIGRIQGDSAKFMILETYSDDICTISVVNESSLEEKARYIYRNHFFIAFYEASSGNGVLLGSFDSPIAIEIDRNSGQVVRIIDPL